MGPMSGQGLWAGGTLGGLDRKRFPLGRDVLLVPEPAPRPGLCWVPLAGLYSLPERCPAKAAPSSELAA